MAKMQRNEMDIRANILDTLLTCPHRDVKNLVSIHGEMCENDPIFYAHLGVWAQENTDIRDHKELFIAKMFISEFPEYREAAFMMLQSLPPYEVNRVIDHIKGKNVITKDGKIYEERFGKNLPRIFRSAVEFYLRSREANQNWFDSCILESKRDMMSLYCRCRIAPGSDHVRAALFNQGEIDSSSRYAQLKALSTEKDDTKQAEIIVKGKIPYTTAVGAIKKITPPIFIALINNMTPQQILVNLGNLKKRGALDNKEVSELVNQKLEEAKKDKKVDVLKASQASKHIKNLDDESRAKIESISDEKLKELKINKSTAMFIDKSGSMTLAIELAKHIGALISPRCISDFYCYAFDGAAFNIDCKSPNLSDWERALKGIVANGTTAIGAPLVSMSRKNEKVEQIMIISDFEEMGAPRFADEYIKYSEKLKTRPNIILVDTKGRHSGSAGFINQLKSLKIDYDIWTLEAGKIDYYSLPNLLRFLTKPGKFELIQEILDTPLPKRVKK